MEMEWAPEGELNPIVGEPERHSVIKCQRIIVRVKRTQSVKPGGTAEMSISFLSQRLCMGQERFFVPKWR